MIKQPTFSQDEIATILIRVARKLAPKFKFGYHSVEDMQQQAHIEALKAIPKFDLAKATDLAQGTISQYEAGNINIDLYALIRICDGLGCSLDHLLGR